MDNAEKYLSYEGLGTYQDELVRRLTDLDYDPNRMFADKTELFSLEKWGVNRFGRVVGYTQRPKQYDIIVYSTYGTTTNTNTSTTKTSSQQTLVSATNDIVKKLNGLIANSKSTSKTKNVMKR